MNEDEKKSVDGQNREREERGEKAGKEKIPCVLVVYTCLVIGQEEVNHTEQLKHPFFRATSVHLVVIQNKVRIDLIGRLGHVMFT